MQLVLLDEGVDTFLEVFLGLGLWYFLRNGLERIKERGRDEDFLSTCLRNLLGHSVILVAADLKLLEDIVGNSYQGRAVGPGQNEENKRHNKVDDGGAKLAPLWVGLHGVIDLRTAQLGSQLLGL